MKHVSRVVENF